MRDKSLGPTQAIVKSGVARNWRHADDRSSSYCSLVCFVGVAPIHWVTCTTRSHTRKYRCRSRLPRAFPQLCEGNEFENLVTNVSTKSRGLSSFFYRRVCFTIHPHFIENLSDSVKVPGPSEATKVRRNKLETSTDRSSIEQHIRKVVSWGLCVHIALTTDFKQKLRVSFRTRVFGQLDRCATFHVCERRLTNHKLIFKRLEKM